MSSPAPTQSSAFKLTRRTIRRIFRTLTITLIPLRTTGELVALVRGLPSRSFLPLLPFLLPFVRVDVTGDPAARARIRSVRASSEQVAVNHVTPPEEGAGLLEALLSPLPPHQPVTLNSMSGEFFVPGVSTRHEWLSNSSSPSDQGGEKGDEEEEEEEEEEGGGGGRGGGGGGRRRRRRLVEPADADPFHPRLADQARVLAQMERDEGAWYDGSISSADRGLLLGGNLWVLDEVWDLVSVEDEGDDDGGDGDDDDDDSDYWDPPYSVLLSSDSDSNHDDNDGDDDDDDDDDDNHPIPVPSVPAAPGVPPYHLLSHPNAYGHLDPGGFLYLPVPDGGDNGDDDQLDDDPEAIRDNAAPPYGFDSSPPPYTQHASHDIWAASPPPSRAAPGEDRPDDVPHAPVREGGSEDEFVNGCEYA
ncbi:hypothetical protein MKZ38_001778 [Zalerion maritima]|uniref:Uncharacterized protein n=1 Tax=Zalerion maritima TaxID=339359 RepID=A0AAD5WWY8_9PEZI|nr:hypothetical protein MKZ38_001778 [Zalerion maritima]